MTADERVIALTGGTSGIGRAAARKLAARGATVVITGRREAAGETVCEEIRAAHPAGKGAFYPADLGDLDAVRGLAAGIETDFDRLDVLVNNAGTVQSRRTLTDDGIERTFAVNYVAPFLLTNVLLPRLRERGPSRVLNTVTMAQDETFDAMCDGDLSDVDAVTAGEEFATEQAYVNSKLAMALFTYELAERFAGTGVRATSFNPGWIPTTGIVREAPASHRFVFKVAGLLARVAPVGKLETVDGGAETLVHHALDQDLPDGDGTFFDGRARTDPGPSVHDEELRERLWAHTAELTGLSESVVAGQS